MEATTAPTMERGEEATTATGLDPLPQEHEVTDSVTSEPEATPEPPWEGPFLGITRTSAGVYAAPRFKRSLKLGYVQEGALVPIRDGVVDGEGCRTGWYEAVGGGYVCGDHGTTNLKDPRITNAPNQPALDAILPYKYARNARNGAPLYRSVPSKEQQRVYEPYLFKDELAKQAASVASTQSAASPSATVSGPSPVEQQKARDEQARRMEAYRRAQLAMLGEEALKKLQAAESNEQQKPTINTTTSANLIEDATQAEQAKWWQQDNVDPSTIRLADLSAEGDDILAMRLVKGFYIAVDRTFRWNGRQWFRSTKGFVAPTDTFHLTAGSKFQGVELDATWQLPIGWVYGFNKTRNTYSINAETKTVKVAGSVKRFTAVNLTGEELEVGKTRYAQTADGSWMRVKDLRITRPAEPPADLAPDERWLDINVSTQTAILFKGTQPLYATLVSTGRSHRDKEKDHSTPLGEWRVREKHIASTMDGDGTAAGDLPYSIEGVPYVMYYEGSYAVHGAFWHENYGVKMSHGCVNMAPLDAKYFFFHTDPPVPQGWHGAWSATDRPGSRVVVHE